MVRGVSHQRPPLLGKASANDSPCATTWLVPSRLVNTGVHQRGALGNLLIEPEQHAQQRNGDQAAAELRAGQLADNRLVATPLASMVRIAYASPDYLRRRGVPTEPTQLMEHDGLDWDGLAG